MEILVCVKQVPDDLAKVTLTENKTPAMEGIDLVVNAFDTYALEMAVRCKETCGGTVTVASVGEEVATKALRSCLAVGADFAYRIEGDSQNSTSIKSALIADAVALMVKKADLIFCGYESTDSIHGQFGVQLAEKMHLPIITGVVALEANTGGILAHQEIDGGYRVVEASYPCVITVLKPAYEPRYPSIKSKLAARKMPIQILAPHLQSSVVDTTELIGLNICDQSRDGLRIQEEDTAVTIEQMLSWLTDKKLI